MFGTPESVLYAILGVILVENLFEVYLSWRQCNVYRKHKNGKVPAAIRVKCRMIHIFQIEIPDV